MTNDRTILITGVTGKQGGAVAQALRDSGFRLRGLTRHPESERATALARDGVDIIRGDLDDESTLQRALTARVDELQTALSQVKKLSGLLPICAYCKRIRVDGGYWEQVERYVAEHSDAQFSHGICPACMEQATRAL